MNNHFRIVAVAVSAIVLLTVAGCAAPPDIKLLEDKVAALEGDVATLEGQVGKASSLEGELTSLTGQVAALTLAPAERTFYMTGVEYKGLTTSESLAAPDVDPATLSKGYRYKAPGYDETAPTRWEVSTYRFEPGAMLAAQGDEITLVIFIVNGDKHTVHLLDPSGSMAEMTMADMPGMAAHETVMNRGREYRVTFTADQPGVYALHCDEHEPTMTAYLLVLPGS